MMYRKEGDEYVLSGGPGAREVRMKEVALLYSGAEGSTVIHAHGEAKWIEKCLHERRRQLLVQGKQEKAFSLQMIRSATVDCDDLNKCVGFCRYVGRPPLPQSLRQPETHLAAGM